MPSITARQVRNTKTKKGELPNPKEKTLEAHKDVKSMSSALGAWNVGFLDIETTGLGADFGFVLGACIKPATSDKIITFRIDDYKDYRKDLCNDYPLIMDICKAVDDFDVVVHYNGDNFDLPFLDTRLAIHGEKHRVSLIHSIDLLPIVKKKMRLHSNRLDTVSTALGLTNSKTKLEPQIWQRASHGSKPDLDYIIEHCEADVLVLEELFKRLKSFIDTIFRRR
jgi:uncharacterized protein